MQTHTLTCTLENLQIIIYAPGKRGFFWVGMSKRNLQQPQQQQNEKKT